MALEFDESNHVDTGTDSSLTPNQDITVMCWVNPDVAAGTDGLVSKNAVGFPPTYLLRKQNATLFTFEMEGTAFSFTTASFSAGVWSHLAFTYDGTDGRGYQDGVLLATVNNPGITMPVSTLSGRLATLAIPAGGTALDGLLDDARIYNRQLSTAEILTIFTLNGKDSIIHGRVGHWRMNEASPGTTASGVGSVKDLTGVNDGTPGSSPVYRAGILSFGRRAS